MPADATKQDPACIVSMHVLGVTPIAGTCKGNACVARPTQDQYSIFRSRVDAYMPARCSVRRERWL